ncbi:MAG TPA: efflux RND transporter periplasmic adaptor subunit [Steroidobacteraceae bacterium]|nr:efflux RND transporter periplasmic adaptor subunit [Steroidobacteraceae bacterium]
MTLSVRTAVAGAIVVCAAGSLAGFWWAQGFGHAPAASAANGPESQRPALYWYDPMVPAQHFDKPGKSPFMDMQLVPRYAEDNGGERPGIRIDPRLAQNLGVRLARVERREVSQSVEAPGTVVFNGRDTAIVQARAAGFVSRVYPHAPGDVVSRNTPLVDLLMPEWAAAQTEFLALLDNGDAPLIAAARQRLALLGMPLALIAQVESSRQIQSAFTVSAPIAGTIDALEIRAGMTVGPGTTLATIKSIDPIWIEAALPEAAAALVSVGGTASVHNAALPDRPIMGRIIGVLPQANADTHTLRVRIELPNHTGFWRPGMFAHVRLTGGAHQDALLVPSEAVIHTGTRDLVIVASTDHRFEPVEVRIGEQYDNDTRIIAGLQEGQQIVVSGQFLIDSEASLRGAEARMGPETGASDATNAHGGTP